MSSDWNVAGLLASVAQRGDRPAVILPSLAGRTTWSCATLARGAETLARGLLGMGVQRTQPIALWAPNSPDWIIVALAIMAAGGVLVAIDDLSDDAQLAAALEASGARLIFTTSHHLASAGDMLRARGVATIRVDARNGGDAVQSGWPMPRRDTSDALPGPAAGDTALFGWTSGTTGAAKGFLLSYRNIGSNVAALQQLDIVGADDRVLLPLPLHHAYPFVVGMLTPLAIGAAIVLPESVTGPSIMQALRDGKVTTIIGVPRLYEAMLAAIRARVADRGAAARALCYLLLRSAVWTQRHAGLRPGRVWFAPVRRGVAPRLRYLVCGGARLDATTEDQLEALGWAVLVGYGLAETASLFTGNPPRERRRGSAGRPLAGGEIRIVAADAEGIGEIELRGASITAGYVNDPDSNRSAFTPDGWLRTGDVGRVDRDGFLYITGRSKDILVLGGGKKIDPEALERSYGSAPQISEIAVLEADGTLVALVRPDPARIHEMGTTNLREGVRVSLAEVARELPAYQRLAGFALTDQPLPRTRLGKYRRFLLPALYRQALGHGARRTARPLTPDDQELLRDPIASAVWALLRERYPERALDLDVTLGLELNLDSFGWIELALALQQRCGVVLTECDIAAIDTIRDLLRRCAALRPQGRATAPAIADAAIEVDRFLAPTGPLLTLLGVVLYAINWITMRVLFRLQVSGRDALPVSGAFVITPNHSSYLDPLVIAAALPLSRMRRVYWAGSATLLFTSAVRRLVSRATHVFPVDERHPDAAIAACVAVLRAGHSAVWFPEGWRSPDGALQRFLPGIGGVLLRAGAPAVPTRITGTFAAWPRGRCLPKLERVSVIFGDTMTVDVLRAEGVGGTEEAPVAQALRERVLALGEP
jgi:long-chain acyl-CoA synthetase